MNLFVLDDNTLQDKTRQDAVRFSFHVPYGK